MARCLFRRSERGFFRFFSKSGCILRGGNMRKQNFTFSQRTTLTSKTTDPVTPLKGRPHEDDHNLWSLVRAAHTPLPSNCGLKLLVASLVWFADRLLGQKRRTGYRKRGPASVDLGPSQNPSTKPQRSTRLMKIRSQRYFSSFFYIHLLFSAIDTRLSLSGDNHHRIHRRGGCPG